jgi:CRP/FNR family transcriptional regulator
MDCSCILLFPDEHILEGTSGTHNRVFNSGEIIYTQSSTSSGIYVLNEGDVLLVKSLADQKMIPVSYAHKGDILGAASLSSGFYTNTAEAINVVQTCFISKKKLLLPSGDYIPGIKFKIMQQVMADLGSAEEHITSVANQNLSQRLLYLLYSLSKNLGKDINGQIPIDLPLPKLAQWMGCSLKTIEKNIELLINKKVIKRSEFNQFRFEVRLQEKVFYQY